MDGRGGLTGPRGQYGGSAPGKAVWMGVGIEGGRQGGHTPSVGNGSWCSGALGGNVALTRLLDRKS